MADPQLVGRACDGRVRDDIGHGAVRSPRKEAPVHDNVRRRWVAAYELDHQADHGRAKQPSGVLDNSSVVDGCSKVEREKGGQRSRSP